MTDEKQSQEAISSQKPGLSNVGSNDLLGDHSMPFELKGAVALSPEEVHSLLSRARYCSFLDDGTCMFYERPVIEAKK